MAEVTVYNATKEKINGLYKGRPYEIPPTAGGEVGQILVSDKCADAIIAEHKNKVTLNRGDIAGTVNNIADKLKLENEKLVEENAELRKENDFLKNQLEKIKKEYEAKKGETKK